LNPHSINQVFRIQAPSHSLRYTPYNFKKEGAEKLRRQRIDPSPTRGLGRDRLRVTSVFIGACPELVEGFIGGFDLPPPSLARRGEKVGVERGDWNPFY